jgi:Chitobiase/beta-hexosaminidase C-terminal domain
VAANRTHPDSQRGRWYLRYSLSLRDVEELLKEPPTFSPGAGTYATPQTITISTTTANATIYYTTDGSTPTTSSAQYSSAINVSINMTIKLEVYGS